MLIGGLLWEDASKWSISCRFRGAGPISWNPLQAAKQRSCGVRTIPPPKYSSPKGDWHIPYNVEDDSRSRFAEPWEGEVMLVPQLRSFGACSGFLTDTCPLGTRRWLMSYYERLRGYGETPSDTIFAFLMLNTMSWAHNKIFGAKFLSFERAAIVCWHTADYAAEKRSVQWMTEPKSIIGLQ